jgi:SnoaL-like domain
MTKIDIVRDAYNFDTPTEIKAGYLTDDFKSTDSTGGAVGDRNTWIGMDGIFKASFPDIAYDIDEIHQEGEDVIVSGYFTGTFMHDLDLSALHLGVIKSTGKAFKIGPGISRVSFRGEKISQNHQMNGGMVGFLAELSNGKNKTGFLYP